MSSMLAAVYRDGSGIALERVPIPRIGSSEVLLRVENASICATDIRILKGAHRKYGPGDVRIPGHEIVGTIEETGAGVTGLARGQRVLVAPNVGCGKCVPCRRGMSNLCQDYDAFGITLNGGFAEFMRVTESAVAQGNLIPLLEGGAEPAVAALAEPFACVLHGQDAVDLREGDIVVVQGAGPIGVMHALLARVRGAARVIVSDPIAQRLTVAAAITGARTVDPVSGDLPLVVAEESGGSGADVVIVAAPSPDAQRVALELAAPGGRICFFAGLPKQNSDVSIDANLVHYKELIITGTTACSTADCRRALQLIVSGAVDLAPLISARFALERAQDAFAAAQDRNNLKVVFEMTGHRRFVGGEQIAAQGAARSLHDA